MKIDRFKKFDIDKNQDFVKGTIFYDLLKKDDELQILKNDIMLLINEWLEINKSELGIEDQHFVSFEITKNPNFPILLMDIRLNNIYVDYEDYNDLLLYIDSPEAYKSREEYNL